VNAAWLLFAVGTPALLALLTLIPACRAPLARALPLAPVPALLSALRLEPDVTLELPWLLFGGEWALDPVRRLLLAQMSLVWVLGGLVASRHAVTAPLLPRLVWPWLCTLTGSTWVALAHDIAGFYSGFALLSFGAYPLIIARGGDAARRAGCRYLGYTVGAEMALLVGLLGASALGAGLSLSALPETLSGPNKDLTGLLTLTLLAGFGVKSALLGAHGWLPSTYTLAPAPVRMVLGGALINAGVLGWLAVLPLGRAAFPVLGQSLMALGLLAAIGGALRGTLLTRVPTMLGWSSISQMGLITLLLGAGLASDQSEVVLVLALYAAHHGLAKAALFAGSAAQWSLAPAARWGLLLPALALAGAPFTSGAVAKLSLKQLLDDAGLARLVPLASLAAVGTTLLLLRVVQQVRANMAPIAGGGAIAAHAIAAHATAAHATAAHATAAHEGGSADSANTSGTVAPFDWRWLTILAAVASAVWWWPVPMARDAGATSSLALVWPIALGALVATLLARWRPMVAVRVEPIEPAESPVVAGVAAAPAVKPATAPGHDAGGEELTVLRAARGELMLRRALPWLLGLVWLGGWVALQLR
jgi:formate hydrogenlyase subunit 3/multisubunit Na+/H+ antiporter MnhD subunit